MKTKIRIKSSLKHFFNVFDDERGIVIPITLVVMVVMLIITGSFTNVLTYETRESAKFKRKIQAFYIADGAIERGMYQLNQSPTWRAGWSNVSLGAGTYTVTITAIDDDADSDFDEDDNGADDRLKVTATATVGDAPPRRVSRYVNEIDNVVPPFKFGAFGDASVDVGNGKLASYNSSTSSLPNNYNSANSDGDVGTNGIQDDAIDLGPNGNVKGDAIVGPGGDPNVAIDAGPSQITGTRTASSTRFNLSTPMLPTSGYTYYASITPTTPLIAGNTYITESINLSGTDTVIATGPVKIFVKNSFSMSGNSVLKAATEKPADLAVYCRNDVISASISGNATFYGLLYAPKADITLSGSGNENVIVAGAIVGKTAKFNGNKVTLYYDEAMFGNSSIQVAAEGASGYSRAASWEGQ